MAESRKKLVAEVFHICDVMMAKIMDSGTIIRLDSKRSSGLSRILLEEGLSSGSEGK